MVSQFWDLILKIMVPEREALWVFERQARHAGSQALREF